MKKRLPAILLAACFAAPLTACGNDSEKEIRNLSREIEELQEKCEELESDLADARSAIDDISETLDDHSASIVNLDEDYGEISETLSALCNTVNELSEPTEEETTVNQKGGVSADDNNIITDSDGNALAVPLTHGGTIDIGAVPSDVEDEEIAPGGAKIPDDYKPRQVSDYVIWLDISEKKNFVFNGETVLVTMKIKKDAPDGVYPVAIRTDLSDVDGNPLFADEEISGSICVNSKAAPFIIDPADDFIFYGDNVACKPGDTVEFNINIANNPGLAAFAIYIYYDSNAIEIEDMEAAGEFKKINDKW